MKILKTLLLIAALGAVTSPVSAQKIAESELKKNVTPLNGSLSYIIKLQPLAYEYHNEKYENLRLPAGRRYGFNSEDVRQVLPEIVSDENKFYPFGKNSYKTATISTTDLQSLIPILVAAVKEQQQEIENLKAEVNRLKLR